MPEELLNLILVVLAALVLYIVDKIGQSKHRKTRPGLPYQEPPYEINDSLYVRYKDGHGEFLTGEKLDAHVRSIPLEIQDLIREIGPENWLAWCKEHGAVFETDTHGRVTSMKVDKE